MTLASPVDWSEGGCMVGRLPLVFAAGIVMLVLVSAGMARATPILMAGSGSGVEGSSATINLGSFTDPGGSGPWSGVVNWDDATTNTFTLTSTGSLGTATHTYAEEGLHNITVSVTDTG